MPPVKILSRTGLPPTRTISTYRYAPTIKRHAYPSVDMVTTTSYFVGKGIILFTMFYTSMNWIYYRGLRKEVERDQKDRDSK